MDLELRRIGRAFKGKPVLTDISFTVGPRELVSVVGPSGVGKTTLLNIIAGLDRPDTGEIIFSTPPGKDNPVIIVFQDYVLFPSMTVAQNIAFGLRARRLPKNEIRQKVNGMLDFFRLEDRAGHYPAQLSAGQKQRVAIARAMVVNPGVLLLDEPFANLDRNLKMETARFIRNTQQSFGIPTVSVTHDLEEAFAMSDRIGVLLDGRLGQFDTPEAVYFSSASEPVARFLGPVNRIPRELFHLIGGRAGSRAPDPGDTGQWMIRPETLELSATPQGPGRIIDKTFAGHYFAYRVALKDSTLAVYCQDGRFSPGQAVSLKLKTTIQRKLP